MWGASRGAQVLRLRAWACPDACCCGRRGGRSCTERLASWPVRARACVAAPSGGHTLADSVRRSVWVQAILSEHDESYAERQDQAGNHWIKRSGFNTNQIHDFQVRRACMPLSRLPARSGLDLSQDSCRSECT